MKKIYSGLLFSAFLLVMAGYAFAASQEQSTSASVTVNEFVSITLSDPAGDTEIAFGAINPNTNDNPDQEQNVSDGAITVTNDPISNVNVNVSVKGTDFTSASTAATIDVGQVTYDDDNNPSDDIGNQADASLSTAYATYFEAVSPSSSVDFWFFLDVQSGQTAATDYQSTISFMGES